MGGIFYYCSRHFTQTLDDRVSTTAWDQGLARCWFWYCIVYVLLRAIFSKTGSYRRDSCRVNYVHPRKVHIAANSNFVCLAGKKLARRVQKPYLEGIISTTFEIRVFSQGRAESFLLLHHLCISDSYRTIRVKIWTPLI